MKQQNNLHYNYNYITLATVISSIAVVYLHANGCFWQFSNSGYWFRANIIESVFYFAVPIFFMISGITLIDYNKRYGLKEYFIKRFNKTFIPFIFWSLIGFWYLYSIGITKVSKISGTYIINKLLEGRLVGIYWFFIPLFAVYLSIPLLAAVEDKYKKPIFLYLAIICFIFNSLIPFILNVSNSHTIFNFVPCICGGFIIYTIIGYLIHKYQINSKLKIIIYIFAIIGLLSHIIGTYFLSIEAETIIRTYKGYLNVPCIFYSIGIFLLIKDYGDKFMQNAITFKIINFLKNYTFSIYLLHIFVLKTMVKLLNLDTHTIIYIIVSPFVAIFFSILITYIIRKVPYLKRVLP